MEDLNFNDSLTITSEDIKDVNYINDIKELKRWYIYNFRRDWLGEKEDNSKGKWRPCIVYGIDNKSIKLLPLSSKPSKDEYTIKFDSKTRKKPSYICIDFLKILDPIKIEIENICTKTLNIETLENNAKISSKILKGEIKNLILKYTNNMNKN